MVTVSAPGRMVSGAPVRAVAATAVRVVSVERGSVWVVSSTALSPDRGAGGSLLTSCGPIVAVAVALADVASLENVVVAEVAVDVVMAGHGC